MQKNSRFEIRLESELKETLEKISKQHNKNKSEFVRDLIEEYLNVSSENEGKS